MQTSGDVWPFSLFPEQSIFTMPTVEWTCMACGGKLMSPSEDTSVICKTMDMHYAVCEKYTSSQKQNWSNPRAVNKHVLDKMEIKDKVNSMAPAEWARFKDRWNLWTTPM